MSCSFCRNETFFGNLSKKQVIDRYLSRFCIVDSTWSSFGFDSWCVVCETGRGRTRNSVHKMLVWSLLRFKNVWGFCPDSKCGWTKKTKNKTKDLRLGLFTQKLHTSCHSSLRKMSPPLTPCLLAVLYNCTRLQLKHRSWKEGLRPGKGYFCTLQCVPSFCTVTNIKSLTVIPQTQMSGFRPYHVISKNASKMWMLFACQGWKWHSPACYWVGEDLLSFDEAKKSCEGDGATLVTITNRYVEHTYTHQC